MANRQRSATRAESVYAAVRADILAGRLVPGQRLKFQDLFDRYSTSVGAVREALTRLAGEGLVRAQPRLGYMVSPLSPTDLADLSQARVEIESLALRLSVEAGDRAWEAEVVAAHYLLDRTPLDPEGSGQPSEEWARVHTAFHTALISACPNRRLFDMACSLRTEAALYQLWSVSLQREPDRDGADEHRGLLTAAVGRDADLAARRLRDHLEHTTRIVLGAPSSPSAR